MKLTKDKLKYLSIYTVCFAILFFVCYSWYFLKYGKTFFRTYDGIDQHYLSFMNLGIWLREIFQNIFINHNFTIQLWNNGIGYGADILTSNSAYYFDIFNWISFFIPSKFSELGFNVVIVLKFYVTGLAFSYFGFYKKQSFWAVLAGSIIYTFSGVTYITFIETFFINVMFILPFVIVGADKLLRENKAGLYVISLAYAFINYFYFAYMICIFVFVYCILSFCLDKDIQKTWKNLLEIAVRFIIFSLIGIGISMVVVLPIINMLGESDRLKIKQEIPIMYNAEWYINFLKGFITSFSMSDRDAIIGFGAISLPAVICVFLQGKKYTKQKIEFILITIGLCVPLIGSIMNGFSYYANRWCFVYALIVAYMVTIAVEEFKNLSKKQIIILCILVLVYAIASNVLANYSHDIVATSILAIICAIACSFATKMHDKMFKYIFLGLASISVVVSSFYNYDENHGNATKEEEKANVAYGYIINGGGLPLLNEVDTSDASRYDENKIGRINNASWIYGVSGIDFYTSVYNNNIDRWHNKLGLNTNAWPMAYSGLDKRAELEALCGVNHYLVRASNEGNKPYGYNNLELRKNIASTEYASYAPENKNSIIYGFEKSIKQSEYDRLSEYDRQQVLTQAIVVPDDMANNSVESLNIQNDSISYEIKAEKDIEVNNKQYMANGEYGIISLNFDEIKDSEIYVYFKNINFDYYDKAFYNVYFIAYNDDKTIRNEQAMLSRCKQENSYVWWETYIYN